MISLKEIKPNIFELTETLPSWYGNKLTFWYWDLDKRLLSEKSDFPDNMRTRKLTEADLDWFEINYRPLIIRREPIDYENLDSAKMSHV